MIGFDAYTDKIVRMAVHVKKFDMRIVIVDLDGTIADGSHRLHLLPTENQHLTETWLPFNAACIDDSPIKSTIEVVNMLTKHPGCYVVILTGRSDHVEGETRNWLADNGVRYDYLIMRSHEDNRKDTVIKEEFLRTMGLDRIVCAFDDSPNVINHFRGLGITTYAVTEYADKDRTDLKSHGVTVMDKH